MAWKTPQPWTGRPEGPGHTEPWLRSTGLLGLLSHGLDRWQEAHEQAADMRHINAMHRFRKNHPESDTYIEVGQQRWKPIDQPRQGSREDVADSTFFGTLVEKRSWWPW